MQEYNKNNYYSKVISYAPCESSSFQLSTHYDIGDPSQNFVFLFDKIIR